MSAQNVVYVSHKGAMLVLDASHSQEAMQLDISTSRDKSEFELELVRFNSVCTLSMHLSAVNTHTQHYNIWQLMVIWALRPALLHQQSA